MKTISQYYSDEVLCMLHDKAMAYYQACMGTPQAHWFTMGYDELVVHALGNSQPELREFAAFLLVYKHNVYDIDQANDERADDKEAKLLKRIMLDAQAGKLSHGGKKCYPRKLQQEMGWSAEMTESYMLQAFCQAYEYNGED